MDGLCINGITLYLTSIPGKERLAFCFKDGGRLYPVAYVPANSENIAVGKWKKMLGEEK